MRAGAICQTGPIGCWWVSVPKEHWPTAPDWRSWLRSHWVPGYGDRRQELVFIGIGMDEAAMRAALDACLVGPADPKRFDPVQLKHLPDPFPAWESASA